VAFVTARGNASVRAIVHIALQRSYRGITLREHAQRAQRLRAKHAHARHGASLYLLAWQNAWRRGSRAVSLNLACLVTPLSAGRRRKK